MNQVIEDDLMQRIKTNTLNTELFYADSKITIVFSEFCNKSFYAPYYVGIYTDGTKKGKMNAGYVMQQLTVYLTAIGIGSCYQAQPLVFQPVNQEGMILSIGMAFGYPEIGIYRDETEIKRLKLDKLCVIKEKPNREIEKILTLARVAPSSFNMQPWRFIVYKNRIHVFAKKRLLPKLEKYKYVNMGIMLANIVVGAEELWIDIVIKEKNSLITRDYGDNEYFLTIYNKDVDGHQI